MSVRSALNIESLLLAADEAWPQWSAAEPVLAQFSCWQEVQQWRLGAGWQEDREVLLGLGRLTMVEESRTEARAVLVALVLPACEAAVAVRARNATDAREVEQVAAGLVWVEVAQYPWGAPMRGWIPQAIARRVGRGVDREFGWGAAAERTWRERTSASPQDWERLQPRADQRPVQWGRLYWWALTQAQVSRADLDLLVALAVSASQERVTSRRSAGITATAACRRVAGPGQSAQQLQHRAIKALKQLRAAAVRPAA